MDTASFRSAVAMLSVLGMFVAMITSVWRFGNLDLTGRHANLRGVYARSIAVGLLLATLLRANIIDILQNPQGPAVMLGWMSVPWASAQSVGQAVIGIVEEVVGLAVTGVVIAFIGKFWNDVFDTVYEFKRWMRGKANQVKPEEGMQRPSNVTSPPDAAQQQMRRRGSRGGRRRHSGGPGGGRDYRDRDRGDRGDRGGGSGGGGSSGGSGGGGSSGGS